MRNMTIMHRKYLALEQYHCNNYNNSNTITTITVGVTAESAVTPTVIVALSAQSCFDSDSKQSLQDEEERP